jgi:hypothetical protein
MKIAATCSHVNGLEFLLVHHRRPRQESQSVIHGVDASRCKTGKSGEKRMNGKMLYSPKAMNKRFGTLLKGKNRRESRVGCRVTGDEKLIRKTLTMPPGRRKYEGGFCTVVRRGRGVPAVRPVLVGIEP